MLGINRKYFLQGSDSNPEPTAWEPCCPTPTAVIYFWIKRVGNFGQIKKRTTTLLNEQFFSYISYTAKNNKFVEVLQTFQHCGHLYVKQTHWWKTSTQFNHHFVTANHTKTCHTINQQKKKASRHIPIIRKKSIWVWKEKNFPLRILSSTIGNRW